VFLKSPKKKKSRRTITLPAILMDALHEQRIQQQRHKELFGPDCQDLDLVFAMPDGSVWAPDRFTDAYMAFARSRKAAGGEKLNL
jgi:hypothetical protein